MIEAGKTKKYIIVWGEEGHHKEEIGWSRNFFIVERLHSPMRKITKLRKPEQDKHIYSEGIDYLRTGRVSIWGAGDKKTIDILRTAEIHGKWLNLAAGDGRYNIHLLEKADVVVASDVDESALSKLWNNTPKPYQPKLETAVVDITQKFPYENNSFDGVFCAGTLHLFPKMVLEGIIEEIDRVLKKDGKIILDFATDITRNRLDGKPYLIKREPKYTLDEAKKELRELFRDYRIKMYESNVPEEILPEANPPYKFKSKFILLVMEKK